MNYELDNFLFDLGRKTRNEEEKLNFNQYFELVLKHPEISYTATQRLYHMIMSHGTNVRSDGSTEYLFFKNRIFGAEKQIEDIVMYLKAASMGLDIKKRVLLLLGPPGGGKSQILTMFKGGMEEYSKSSQGAMYAIEQCPINEDPLHLIPESRRQELWDRYGVRIEGKLCPFCQFMAENDWSRNLNNVMVKRIFASEQTRTGVGTFAPTEKNEMSELYGAPNKALVDYYGDEADPRAYKFTGELHKANRGIMEFIEVLKAKSDFLHVLLTLAEEQQFKTPRFPLQYVDEALIAHTNEGEFNRFIANQENEAVIDRFYIVKMPYNMEVTNEEKIYHLALKTKLNVKNVKVHPGSIRMASLFAIETRKHDNPLRVGMGGISPRFILNTIAIASVKVGKSVIEPADMWNVLFHQVYHYPVLSIEQRKLYLDFLEKLKLQIPSFSVLGDVDIKTHGQISKKGNSMFDLMIGDD